MVEGIQYALTVDNQLIPIQCVVSNTAALVRENTEWSTSSSRSCSSTSSSGICSTASSDESNQQKAIKVARVPIEKLRFVCAQPKIYIVSHDNMVIIRNWIIVERRLAPSLFFDILARSKFAGFPYK